MAQNGTSIRGSLNDMQRRALIAGAIAAAACILGVLLDRERFFPSYLFAYIYWLNITLGALAVLMLHHLVSGRWGYVIQRFLEGMVRTIPLMALLFLPILFGMGEIYPWMHEEGGHGGHIIAQKLPYLNVPFFVLRAALYFTIWGALAFTLTAWSRRQDRTADPELTRRLRIVSAPGLILYVFTVTFASVDWMMSLEPEWFSTIYGFMIVVGQVLAALALSVVLLHLFTGATPIADIVSKRHYHHIGNLILAFVVLWAYMSYSQYLIIWAADLPEEISWYLRRLGNGWNVVAVLLVVFHFALPFALLLLRRTKRTAAVLTKIAAGILVLRLVDIYWLVLPAFYPEGLYIHWLDFVTPVAVGGLWVAVFLWQLKGESVLPLHDPRFEKPIEYAEGLTL